MGDIITAEELASNIQSDLDTATADLAIEVVESDIRQAVGTAAYDELADKSAFKGVALDAATRRVGNPEALRSSRIDDSTDGFSETSMTLTKDEIRRCRRVIGRGGGAFSIAPDPVPCHVCTDLCRHEPVCLL